jgi:GH43 family beta-xylosidase
VKRQGSPIFLVHRDGTYYHVANAPEKYNRDVVGAIASAFGNLRHNQWSKVVAHTNENEHLDKVVWNTPLTKLLPPEMQNRIPVLAQNLKKAYGENR